MATTVSAWAKPGAWALDSEEHEAMELLQQQQKDDASEKSDGHIDYASNSNPTHQQPLTSDFPSLSVAAATKSKKKKGQTFSLAEFNTGNSVTYGSAKAAQSNLAKGLTTDELLMLPTGPRERTAEELERASSRGFRSYGSGGMHENGRGSRYSNGDDASNPRWGSSRVSDEPRRNGSFHREPAPSRADEIDDWGAAKKSVAAPPPFERRERSGFFDSQSRADESDSWVTNKTFVLSEGRRVGSGGGFENHRDRRGGFEMFQKESSLGSGADSDSWGKKREEGNGSGRPRLVLQPRTLPLSNGDQQQPGSVTTTKSKGLNPFGEARPREEVLAEKGQDWKKIDEQLESMKIKEVKNGGPAHSDGPSFGKKNFGTGDGRTSLPEDRTERSWRKTDSVDVPTPRSALV
uniref:Eukaryotic translation initiation factor 4B3-like n=1 Tax=Nelumbo nucifera TaxID=4432 RepID=A0A822ZA82_NELNU|nr:TPA_asm: hypothetical protein HUJ06_014652 [Nelumbo nucifera]